MFFVFRGRGGLGPGLLAAGAVFMLPARELGLVLCQSLCLVWILGAGAWIGVYGYRTLRRVEAERGSPLAIYEWLIDPPWNLKTPFDSFMYIQLPWWTLGYAWAAYYLLKVMLERA